MELEYTEFVRKPFLVEAIEITEENLEEVAKDIGAVKNGPEGRYIAVNRRLVQNVLKVYPGYWMTKMGDFVRVYNPKAFHNQFIESDDDWRKKVEEINMPSMTAVDD